MEPPTSSDTLGLELGVEDKVIHKIAIVALVPRGRAATLSHRPEAVSGGIWVG